MIQPATLGLWNMVVMIRWLFCLMWTSTSVALLTLLSRADTRSTINTVREAAEASADEGVPVKLAIVTGASSGLGLAVAKQLLARGDTYVIIACRSSERGLAAARAIVATFEGKQRDLAARRLEVWKLELTDPQSVLGFAKELQEVTPSNKSLPEEPFLAVYDLLRELGVDAELLGTIRSYTGQRAVRHQVSPASSANADHRSAKAEVATHQLPPFGLLVNCAAMLAGSERRCLAGRLGATLSSNVVGPTALQLCLMPALITGASIAGRPSRIITIGSFTHMAANRACMDSSLQELRAFASPVRNHASDCGSSTTRPFRPAVEYMTSKLLATMAAFRVTASIHSARRGHTPAGASVSSSVNSCYDSPPLLQNHVLDPGAIDTALIREWPPWLATLFRVGLSAMGLLHSPDSAAAAVLATATSPDSSSPSPTGGSVDGCYWVHSRGRLARVRPSRLAAEQLECELAWQATHQAARRFLTRQQPTKQALAS